MIFRRAHREQSSQLSSANRRVQEKLQTEARLLQEANRLQLQSQADHAQKLKEQRADAAAQIERVLQDAQARQEDQLEKLNLRCKLEFKEKEQKFVMHAHTQLEETRSLHKKENQEALAQLQLTLDSQAAKQLKQALKDLSDKFTQHNVESEEALRARMRDAQLQQQQEMMANAVKQRQLLESKLILESDSQLQVIVI